MKLVSFPSPAEDYLNDSLDFNRDLIKNPEATFYGRVEGDAMTEAGILLLPRLLVHLLLVGRSFLLPFLLFFSHKVFITKVRH